MRAWQPLSGRLIPTPDIAPANSKYCATHPFREHGTGFLVLYSILAFLAILPSILCLLPILCPVCIRQAYP